MIVVHEWRESLCQGFVCCFHLLCNATDMCNVLPGVVIRFFSRDYAALVAARVRELGVEVEMQQLSPTVSLADALDSAAHQGLLYAIIITSQHEMHRSVTLTILHGRNPQGI